MNSGEHYFPGGQPTRRQQLGFLDLMPRPAKAPAAVVAMCASEREAIAAALAACKERSQSWVAHKLGVSRSYLSMIKAGEKRIPDWMIAPFCVLTGTNILAQYRDLQLALRAAEGRDTDNSRIERIARELRGAR